MENIFKAYDVRGKVDTELTPHVVKNIGRAFADWLPEKGTVVVGHDMRPDSRKLADELINGLTMQGRNVWDIGLASSDMIYFAPAKFDLAGGAMITASHNPSEYNGIKLCRKGARPVGLESGLNAIRDSVLSDKFLPPASQKGSITKKNLLNDWIEQALSLVDVGKIKPFKIGVDAGNGMAGLTFPYASKRLPIEVTPLYFELDGTFPNHEANPMKVETLRDLSAIIVDKGLDFGVAFDGDADRMALVDERGIPLTGSMTCALLAKYVLDKYPSSTIVHDLCMSRSTVEYIHSLGGKTVRSKVGNTIVKEMVRKNRAAMGGEITGHFMFKDNYFVDSGLVAALIALEVLSTSDFTLSEFVKKHDAYYHHPEINMKVKDKLAALKRVANAYNDADIDWLDGLTVSYPDRWFNIRPSNTEPVMRLNVEAKTKSDIEKISKQVHGIIQSK